MTEDLYLKDAQGRCRHVFIAGAPPWAPAPRFKCCDCGQTWNKLPLAPPPGQTPVDDVPSGG